MSAYESARFAIERLERENRALRDALEQALPILNGIDYEEGSRIDRAVTIIESALAAPDTPPDECSLCHVPLATGDCTHVRRANGQVTMTETSWEQIVSELAELRRATPDTPPDA